jgi:hypothetical protein
MLEDNQGMGTALFVWVGSGRARRRKVGPRGVRLDRAAHAGLPVPPGAVLLDELLRVCLQEGLIERSDGRVFFPDPELFHNTLFHSVRLPRFARPVNLIPLFSAESGALSEADATKAPLPPVDLNDAGQTAAALAALWSDALRRPDARADVLALETVAAEAKGRARTLASGVDDRVETDKPARLVLSLPQLRGWHTPAGDLPLYARRLRMLLGGVRRTFGRGDWTIAWADDGYICWLLDVAPFAGA